MKKLRFILYVFFSLFVCVPEATAESTTQLTNAGVIKSEEKGRPRAPQKVNYVTASFDGCTILIDFMEEEGIVHVVLESESGFYLETEGDSAETISIPCTNADAPYNIVIVTDRGNVYEGIIK